MSHPGGVKDSHLLNTTETVPAPWATWLVKDLAFSLKSGQFFNTLKKNVELLNGKVDWLNDLN